jgi:hypothetical protein
METYLLGEYIGADSLELEQEIIALLEANAELETSNEDWQSLEIYC